MWVVPRCALICISLRFHDVEIFSCDCFLKQWESKTDLLVLASCPSAQFWIFSQDPPQDICWEQVFFPYFPQAWEVKCPSAQVLSCYQKRPQGGSISSPSFFFFFVVFQFLFSNRVDFRGCICINLCKGKHNQKDNPQSLRMEKISLQANISSNSSANQTAHAAQLKKHNKNGPKI